MNNRKPFFYRIEAGALIDFATDPEGEGVTLLRFAKDLQKGQSDIPFIQQLIDEAKTFINKKSDAGKKGMQSRWSKRKESKISDNSVITVLSSDITKNSKAEEKNAPKKTTQNQIVNNTVITNDNTPVTSKDF